MKFKANKIIINLTILSFCFTALLPVFTKQTDSQAYRGLIIDALRFDYNNVEPGEVITQSFNVTYDYQPLEDGSYKSVSISLGSRDFTQEYNIGNEPSAPSFTNENTLPANASLASWITFEKSNIILNNPSEKSEIVFTIKVPEDAEPGGKYAAVLLKNTSGNEAVSELEQQSSAGFGLNASLGPLIFLTVGGDIETSLEVEEIYTTNIKDKRKGFFFNPPVNTVVRIKNNGNVHASPKGVVFIHRDSERFSENPIATFELNPNNVTILPGATREFVYTWDDSFITTTASNGNEQGEIIYSTEYSGDISKLRFGKYYSTVQFDYENTDGENIIPQTLKTSYWIIPLPLIIFILVLILLTILFIIYKRKKKSISYKKR